MWSTSSSRERLHLSCKSKKRWKIWQTIHTIECWVSCNLKKLWHCNESFGRKCLRTKFPPQRESLFIVSSVINYQMLNLTTKRGWSLVKHGSHEWLWMSHSKERLFSHILLYKRLLVTIATDFASLWTQRSSVVSVLVVVAKSSSFMITRASVKRVMMESPKNDVCMRPCICFTV